jgi:type II secretory pathway pseudopilin PulG
MVTRRRQRGFSYLLVLMMVAILGATLAYAGVLWGTIAQRERETELLYVGNQFRRAIMRYYENTPGPLKHYPRALEDLLTDMRQPHAQHYLRKVFFDPMTNDRKWGLVPAPDGGIMGVYSQSEKEPLRVANFPERYREFQNAASYQDWKFVHLPRSLGQGGKVPQLTLPQTVPQPAGPGQ